MTKKLEDFFNVDPIEPDRNDSVTEDQQALPIAEIVPMSDALTKIKDQLSVAAKIDEALPQVKGLETEDRALDDYADQAMEQFAKLMDLGFNVITAKTTKLDKKLKMIDLQLKLARLQKDLGKDEGEDKPTELSTDRNAILNLINQNLKNK
jgi:hypothetical protein